MKITTCLISLHKYLKLFNHYAKDYPSAVKLLQGNANSDTESKKEANEVAGIRACETQVHALECVRARLVRCHLFIVLQGSPSFQEKSVTKIILQTFKIRKMLQQYQVMLG